MERIEGLAPAVLLYNLAGQRAAAVERWLTAHGIRPIRVAPADYARPLGALLRLPGTSFASPDSDTVCLGGFSEEMLVMFAFHGTMMQDFLAMFRAEGLSPVALKAVATPTNLQWTSLALHEELAREHAWFLQNRRQG